MKNQKHELCQYVMNVEKKQLECFLADLQTRPLRGWETFDGNNQSQKIFSRKKKQIWVEAISYANPLCVTSKLTNKPAIAQYIEIEISDTIQHDFLFWNNIEYARKNRSNLGNQSDKLLRTT